MEELYIADPRSKHSGIRVDINTQSEDMKVPGKSSESWRYPWKQALHTPHSILSLRPNTVLDFLISAFGLTEASSL